MEKSISRSAVRASTRRTSSTRLQARDDAACTTAWANRYRDGPRAGALADPQLL
jgi:hypothetical protein